MSRSTVVTPHRCLARQLGFKDDLLLFYEPNETRNNLLTCYASTIIVQPEDSQPPCCLFLYITSLIVACCMFTMMLADEVAPSIMFLEADSIRASAGLGGLRAPPVGWVDFLKNS